MATNLILLLLFTTAYTLPNDYYHQEYKYRSSASSYRNNELQTQNDDEGYLSKDGDLSGRTAPVVNSHSQHSEYINPKLRDGRYVANGYTGETSEGYMDVDHVGGSSMNAMNNYGSSSSYGYGGRSSYAYGGTYGNSYSVPSSLRSITQQLQSDYARQLQNYQYGGYNRDFSTLEQELRQNVSQQLQQALANRYGAQSIRNGMSYSILNGRVLPTANYEHQELLDLQRQMENDLISQMRQRYYSQSSSRSYQASNSNYQSYSTSTSTARPYTSYTTHVPVYYSTTSRIPVYSAPYSSYASSSPYSSYTSGSQRESITNIATRVQSDLDNRLNNLLDDLQRNRNYGDYSSMQNRLQSELRSNITYMLDREIQRIYGNQILRDGYMYSTSGNGNYDNQYNYSIRDLENLKQQMENNLIQKLNRDLGRYTSNQSIRTYPVQSRYTDYGTNTVGGSSIGGTFGTSSMGSNYYGSGSDVGHTSRPSSPHLVPLITGTKSHKSYNYESSYGTSGISANTLSDLQSQLQNDLSRQLRYALNRGRSYSYNNDAPRNYQVSFQEMSDELNRNLTRQLSELQSRYSTSGYSAQQFDDLRNQLQNNLMRELQQGLQQSYSSSSSSSYSSSSSSSNVRPVRANLGGNIGYYHQNGEDCQGQYGHAVYKRSTYYHPYRYTGYSQPSEQYLQQRQVTYFLPEEDYGYGRAHTHLSQNQQKQETTTEDIPYRNIRNSFEEKPVEDHLTQQQEEPDFGKLQIGSQKQVEQQQQVEEDLTQQQEESGFRKFQIGQSKVEEIDLTQQQEEPDFGKLQVGEQKQIEIEQEQVDEDLTQKQEEPGFGKLQIASQKQIEDDFSQLPSSNNHYQSSFGQIPVHVEQNQVEDIDLTQQQEEPGFGKLQIGSQQQLEDDFGQQQIEDTHNNHFHSVPAQIIQNQVDQDDLTQQEGQGFGKLEIGSQKQLENDFGQQQIEHSTNYNSKPKPLHITQQQEEETGFGKLQIGSEQQIEDDVGQQQIDSNCNFKPKPMHISQEQDDLTQQQEEPGFRKLQIGSQKQLEDNFGQQQIENSDIDFKPKPSHFNQQQEDLTQQEEDTGFGKLEIGSQKQLENDFGQQEIENLPKQDLEAVGQPNNEQKIEEIDQDLTQQQESGFGKFQIGSQQKIEDDFSYLGNSNKPKPFSQMKPNEDENLTQQEEDGFNNKLEIGNQQVDQNKVDDDELNQQQEKISITTQVDDNIPVTTTIRPSSTQFSSVDREFLAKIERENDMLLEMVRQRALEQRRYQSQNHYYSNSYNSHQNYQQRTYNSPYSGQSYVPQSAVSVPHPQEEETSYNSHNYGAHQDYQQGTYSTPYSGRSYHAPQSAIPKVEETVYHSAELQKPDVIENDDTVQVLEPINFDPKTPTHVKSEYLDKNNVDVQSTTEISTTTEQPGFWKRLGNKISTGAKSIKQKIVG